MDAFRRAWEWLKWPIALALMGGLAYWNRDGLARLSQRQIEWPFLAMALAMCGVCTLLTFFRWYLLVWAQRFPFSFRDAIRLGFIGQFWSYFAPGIVGGDLVKAVILARDNPTRRAVAVATILLDRVLGLLSLFILGAVMTLFISGLPETRETRVVIALLWTGALCGTAGVGLMLIPGIARWPLIRSLPRLPFVGRIVGSLINGVLLYQSRPLVLVTSVLIGIVSHAALIAGFYCGGRALEPWVVDLTRHFYFMPMAELFATFLPTPGGLGGLEGAVQYSYERLAQGEVPADQARNAGFIACLVFRLVQLAIACVGYVYYLASKREISAAMHVVEERSANPPEPPSTATAELALAK